MADYLINFNPGEEIKASEINSNNQYLLEKISDNAESLQTYLESQLGILQSNISSVQLTLQNNLNALDTKLTNQLNTLENAKFTQKTLNIDIGTANLKSYLPNDDKHYLVWISGRINRKSGEGASIASDIMAAVPFLQLDGDSGRSSQDVALTVVPVGAGRTISVSGSADSISLRGYCKL